VPPYFEKHHRDGLERDDLEAGLHLVRVDPPLQRLLRAFEQRLRGAVRHGARRDQTRSAALGTRIVEDRQRRLDVGLVHIRGLLIAPPGVHACVDAPVRPLSVVRDVVGRRGGRWSTW
jgi:hypothetical protein